MGNTSQLLTRGEVRRLLEAHRLQPAAFSPLARLKETPPAGDFDTLQSRDLLGSRWRNALLSLCRPSQAIRVVRPAPEMSAAQLFYRDATDGVLFTGCWPEDEGIRLSRPWTPDGIVNQVQQALWIQAPTHTVPFEVRFTPAGLAAWAAAVDSLRALLLASLLRRTATIDAVIALDKLEEQLQAGWAFEDARWVVTLLRALLPAALVNKLPGADLGAGVRELEEFGLLQRDGRHVWQANEILLLQAGGLKNPLPALAVTATFYNHADAKIFEQGLAIIRGDGPLWVLSFEGDADGNSAGTLRSCSGHDLIAEITAMITREAP
jgi:hypothetical protein